MKYALVDNNIIKVGPRNYHYGFFKQYLTSANLIDVSIPINYSDLIPIVVSETITIVPVEEPNIPIYKPITEQLSGPFWNVNTILITGTYSVVDVELESAKNKLKQLVADYRYTKENGSVQVTLQNTSVTVSTTRGFDRDIWFQSLMLLPAGTTQQYKFPIEQIWLNLTNTDIQTIVSSIVAYVQSAFDWEKNYVDRIVASTDKTSLNTIYDDLMNEVNPTPTQPV